jgi:hypothetical protein
MKQATDHIDNISTSMRETSVSIRQAGKNLHTIVTQVKVATRISRRRRRNGYDGDTENTPDRRTGSKPTKVLSLHVRISLLVSPFNLLIITSESTLSVFNRTEGSYKRESTAADGHRC